ncbi:hypothetical protein ACVQ9Z_08880 [Staphylococcus aureus]
MQKDKTPSMFMVVRIWAVTPEDVINAKDAIINADFVVAQLEVLPSRLLYLHLKLPRHMV